MLICPRRLSQLSLDNKEAETSSEGRLIQNLTKNTEEPDQVRKRTEPFQFVFAAVSFFFSFCLYMVWFDGLYSSVVHILLTSVG